VQGDTDVVPFGRGTFGSRSMMTAGSALDEACSRVIAKARLIAGHLLEVGETDFAFSDGRFVIDGTTAASVCSMSCGPHSVSIACRRTSMAGSIRRAVFAPREPTYPNACHIAEVEVDPDTGHVDILRYVVVDDVAASSIMPWWKARSAVVSHRVLGRPCWRTLVRSRRTVDHGLVHGLRDAARIRDSGPQFHSNEVPSPSIRSASKGPAKPASSAPSRPSSAPSQTRCARWAFRHIDMPVTPERVWRAMRGRPASGVLQLN